MTSDLSAHLKIKSREARYLSQLSQIELATRNVSCNIGIFCKNMISQKTLKEHCRVLNDGILTFFTETWFMSNT